MDLDGRMTLMLVLLAASGRPHKDPHFLWEEKWVCGCEWDFGSPLCTITAFLDKCNQFTCHYDRKESGQVYNLSYHNFLFSLAIDIFICYIFILYCTWKMYQQNKKAGSHTTSIPRRRVMRLTKMVLALISVFVVSTAPFHEIQLMNLQVSQVTLTFYVSYYISICLSYASSSINPFFYILLNGNFQKHLQQCPNMEFRMAEGM